ncbi:YeeE/YedE thiosulfate transporter family protein [Ligilactobacillus sp. LYQ135]
MSKNIFKSIVILGLSFVLAILLVKPIGVSTEYSTTAGIIEKIFDPTIVSKKKDSKIQTNNKYYKDNPKIAENIEHPLSYSMLFVASIPFGALLASLIFKKKNQLLTKEKNNRILNNPLILFLGGFLLLFGARWAGGCTSGHMMSGIMQSSISGVVFALSVFFTGIITAILTFKFARKDNKK